MNITYANLNTKSHYSSGIAVGTTTEIIKKAMDKKLHGLALTDRYTASGLIDYYNKAKELKFPVALGVEFNYHDNQNKLHKIVILAINQNGYVNLCKLVTNSWDKFDMMKVPCLSLYDLTEHKDDIYCLAGHYDQIKDLKSIFKDKLVFQIFIDKNYEESNKKILSSGERYVVTSDAYIPDWDFKQLQDVMLSNSKTASEEDRGMPAKPILSAVEIVQRWKVEMSHYMTLNQLALAFKLSIEILDECSKIQLKFKDQVVNYPHLLHPLNEDGCSKEELVWRIARANGRFPEHDPIYKSRFEYEMDSITNNGRVNLIDYFLVLEDLCRWCRENGITVGPGRGSGAASLINYCLKVTHLDPIQYNLLFERFISKGRIQNGTMPDVDIDFSEQEPVRNYLIEKYGTDRVYRIGTFQTLKTLGSIKDIAKSMQHKYPELDFVAVNNVTKTFGDKDLEESEAEFFERVLEENEVAQAFFQKYPDILDKVERLVGYNRQAGAHPCGMAITQDKVEDFAPLRSYKGAKILDINAGACEQSGILKYDILGLKTLKYIQTTCDLVGIKDIYSIPLDDKETHANFARGDTNGVFQFNSDVAIGILTMIPEEKMSLDVECMTTASGRPGPMRSGMHIEFAKRVSGERFATPPHPALEEELRSTFGIMIYQENVMKASQILGGFTLAEADDIRKAMGKKKASVLVPYKNRFIEHCQAKYPDTKEKHIDENTGEATISKAEHIWNLMATFSGYGFNKAHSMAYALIGYQCQYLKTHHPLEWWTACLMHANDDKLQKYYQDASKYCVDPDINKSLDDYAIIDGKIQMPTSAIKGLGPKAVEEIYNLRPFANFQDFLARTNKRCINKKVVLQLIFAGCFDSLHPDQKQELVNEFFKFRGEKVPEDLAALSKIKLTDLRVKALAYLQRDLYEIYSERFSEELVRYENIVTNPKPIFILGKVESLNKKKTKTGSQYGTLKVSNNGEELSIRMWADELAFYKDNLKEKVELRIKCKVSEYNNQVQLTLISCEPLGV